MGGIEVISSCLVGTSRDVSMSKLALTFWDSSLLYIVYNQKGLLFRKPNSQIQTLIDHLKNSLSKTLDFFPPVAGRLSTTAHDGEKSLFFIDCNNAGVQFSHAVAVSVSVADVLEGGKKAESLSSLFPLNGVCNYEGVSQSLLAVRVTELADGVFIGYAFNHGVMDGYSFWHFINSWSEIARGCATISKLPVFERWFPAYGSAAEGGARLLIHLPTVKKGPVKSSMPQKIFHVSRESLAKMKAEANSEAAGSLKISTLQAVAAHIWRGVTRSASSDGSWGEETCLGLAIGARSRLPLPEGYFGNAFYTDRVTMSEAELLGRGGLGLAAIKMGEFLARQTKEEVIRRVTEEDTGVRRRAALLIGSSPRYDVYGNDFGWGRPVALRSGISNLHERSVRVAPAAEAGGLDFEICFPQETLNALECDAEFMAAVTTY